MKATIQTESHRTVELSVIDNGGTTHRLTVDRTGTLEAHHCEEYPDDQTERTSLQTERLAQVRRFAKYYVFRRRGYDTLTPYDTDDRIAYPDRVAATTLVVGAMSLETFESYFETAYRQRSSATGDAEPPVAPPAVAPDAACQRIEQDVYLDVGDDRLQALLDVLIELEALGALRQSMDAQPDRDDRDLFARLDAILEPTGGPDGRRVHEDGRRCRVLGGTSPIRVRWQTDGPTRVEYESDAEAGWDGPPAARLQLPVTDAPVRSVAAFQRLVVDHLRCQLRDCYVGMGVAPPRDLRVRGPGIAWFESQYERTDVYQRYHDPDAIIDWTRLPPIPDL